MFVAPSSEAAILQSLEVLEALLSLITPPSVNLECWLYRFPGQPTACLGVSYLEFVCVYIVSATVIGVGLVSLAISKLEKLAWKHSKQTFLRRTLAIPYVVLSSIGGKHTALVFWAHVFMCPSA